MSAVDFVASSLRSMVDDATRGVPLAEVGTVTSFSGPPLMRVRVTTPGIDGDIAAAWLPGFASSAASGSVQIGSEVLVVWSSGLPVVVDRLLRQTVAPNFGG